MSGVNGSALGMEPEGGVGPGDESTVESTDAWVCKCGSVNNPEHAPEDHDLTTCVSCGASAFDQEDEDEPDPPSIEDVKAGLSNLAGGIATAQDVENAARSEEGLPPRDQELPLDFGPFNSDAALKAIFEKSMEVRALQADYDDKKDAAKDAKSELDIASKALVNIIESLKNRRTQALNPTQPYLADVSGQAPAATGCPWERDHPGQACPICVQAKAELINVDVNSEVHPEHAGHAAIAEAARVKNVLVPMQKQLEAVNVCLTIEDLQSVSTEDLAALEAYATEPSVMPPHILSKTCVAAAPGSIAQVCGTCQRLLIGVTVAESENENTVIGWYPEGARVGLQHAVQTIDEAVGPPAPRKPRSHARKPAKKREPEVERKAQADEGRARGRAIPKSESARKGAGKSKPAKKAKRK